jgi:hypothetical protein
MSWHFSQALVADYSQANCLDGEQFAPLRSTTMREAYCWRDRMTESLDLFQFGMTSQHSTAHLGAELLMWFRAAFHALTSASPGQCGDATELQEKKAACGLSTCESSTKFSQDSFGGRTPLSLKAKVLPRLFEHWPSAGTFANGQLSELTIAGFLTQENDYGFLLPTPTSRDWKDTPGMEMERKDGGNRYRLPMILFSSVRSAGIEWKQTTVMDAPIVSVRGLPVTIKGRQYCPELPEWLMGWPIGWTDCEPLEMGKFLEWQQQHGASLPMALNDA